MKSFRQIREASIHYPTVHETKDEGEYDYEGDMAMTQLRSIVRNAQLLHDELKPDMNLPEWVQSKITLAEDYIETAYNYMCSEMKENVSEGKAENKAKKNVYMDTLGSESQRKPHADIFSLSNKRKEGRMQNRLRNPSSFPTKNK